MRSVFLKIFQVRGKITSWARENPGGKKWRKNLIVKKLYH